LLSQYLRQIPRFLGERREILSPADQNDLEALGFMIPPNVEDTAVDSSVVG
jgi:hypothetical protein